MTDLLQGQDISELLRSKGPVVKAVLLRTGSDGDNDNDDDRKPSAKPTEKEQDTNDRDKDARPVLADLIDEIEVDTTPKKQMVSQVLGGPFTFLGQYEEEGIVLMVRRDSESLPKNPHKLQPPFDTAEVRGDVLIMKVAPTKEVLDEQVEQEDGENEEVKVLEVPTNDEFFLNYTKPEYIKFASRTDVVAPEPPEDDDEEEEEVEEEGNEEEEEEGDGDDGDDEDYDAVEDEDYDEEEDQVAMMNLILGQVLRQFHEENGRGPDTRELLALRSALAEKMGIDMPEIPENDADWDQKAAKKKKETIEPDNKNEESPVKSILTRKRTIEDADQEEENADATDPEAKRVKFSPPASEGGAKDDADQGKQDLKTVTPEAASATS